MSRTASAIILCWLLADAAPQFAAEPAPPPRPAVDLVASATVAERLLLLREEFTENAKWVKGAKVKFAFRTNLPDAESETGEVLNLFAFVAEEMSFPGEGLIVFKTVGYVNYHFPKVIQGKESGGGTRLAPKQALIRLQFDRPVRNLEDIHNAKLTLIENPGNYKWTVNKADVKLLSK